LLEKLPQMAKTDLVVLELSSYMLEHLRAMKWSPHIALVTMVRKDHVEWHGGVENYRDSKKNIIRFQKRGDVAVLNEEDPVSIEWARDVNGQAVMYGVEGRRP